MVLVFALTQCNIHVFFFHVSEFERMLAPADAFRFKSQFEMAWQKHRNFEIRWKIISSFYWIKVKICWHQQCFEEFFFFSNIWLSRRWYSTKSLLIVCSSKTQNQWRSSISSSCKLLDAQTILAAVNCLLLYDLFSISSSFFSRIGMNKRRNEINIMQCSDNFVWGEE